jgi:DNA-binding transcriptional LysR family regulator
VTQDLARIRAFVQVFDGGGFSAAARQHGRSKALLSKYVTDLEDYLGVRLMNRTTRKLSLTEAGELYYREASQLLQQLDELDATIADQTAAPRGLIRVSAPRNFGETALAPAIFDYMAKNPMVTIDLRLEDRFVDLVEEAIDVALRISAHADSSLIARKIIALRHAVYAAPALIDQVGRPASADALRNLPCVIDTNMPSPSSWRFERNAKPVSVHVAGPVRVNSPVAAMQAAVAGLGFALLPSYLAEPQVVAGRLIEVLTNEMPGGPSLRALYPHRRHLPGKVRALIDHLAAWFAANPVR